MRVIASSRFKLLVLLSLLLLPVLAEAGSGWTVKAPMPRGREAHVAVTAADGTIYNITGYYPAPSTIPVLITSNQAYDPVLNQWTNKADIPTARSLPGAARAADGRIYVIGGFASNYSGIVEAYDPTTDQWTPALATMPTPRYELAVAASGTGAQERLYAMGGFNNGGPSIAAVEAYDPATNTWTTKAPLPTPRRGLGAVTGPNGIVYAIGGSPRAGFGDPFVTTVDAYDPATNTWSARAPMPTARAYHAVALGADGLIYAMGGLGTETTVDVYDPMMNTWRAGPPMPIGQYALAAAASGGRVFAFGGQVNLQATQSLTLAGGSLDRTSIAFGSVEVGSSSAGQIVTYTSDGTLTVTVGQLGLAGANAGDFSITADDCSGRTLAPSGTCTATVQFNPTALGPLQASFEFPDDSAATVHRVTLTGTGLISDTTPPVVTVPPDITVNAQSPAGATVTYVVTAVDSQGIVTSIDCAPPPGLFPIGTTTVSCTATDNRGNTSAPSTFRVIVKGAAEQLADLLARVQGVGPGLSFGAKVRAAITALENGNVATACSSLSAFLGEIAAQSGKSITAAEAAALTATVQQIQAVMGCP